MRLFYKMANLIASPILVILQNRELLMQLLVRDIVSKYRGTYLGVFWLILQPLLMLVLYTFVFGYVFNGKFREDQAESTVQYALGIYIGLNLFHFLSEVLSISPSIIILNKNLVKKVVFPIELLPFVTVASSSVYFIISQGLAIFASFFIGDIDVFGMFWILVIYFPFVILCVGMSWIVSSIGTFVTDTSSFMRFAVLALMFASAVFYPAKDIPEPAWSVMKYNPLIHVIEMSRSVILWNEGISQIALFYLYGLSIAVFYLGYMIFVKLKKHYADVL